VTHSGASGTDSPDGSGLFSDRPGASERSRAGDALASIEHALRALDAGRIDLAREALNAAREALRGGSR